MSVGIGLIINGAALFGFTAVATRALDPAEYSTVAVLLMAVVLVGPGVFQPLEQEVSRAVSNRRAHLVGGGPVIRRAAGLGLGLATLLAAAALAAEPIVLDRLFNREGLVMAGFLLALFGYCLAHLVRGAYSGNGRFRPYATFFATDGVFRVVGCVTLAVAGAATAGRIGLLLGLTPFVAVAVSLVGQRDLAADGPPAPWSEISVNLGWLLVGSLLTGFLVGVGPLAVELFAADDQQWAAGVFLNGLIVARLPLFAFQAVQATLLPKLSHLASVGKLVEFRSGLRRLLALLAVIAAAGIAGSVLVGPTVVRVFLGGERVLAPRDFLLLSVAYSLMMVTISLDQSLIALKAHPRMATGWAVGGTTFCVVALMGDDLFLRVELGLLAGAGAALATMAALLALRLRHVELPGIDLADVATDPGPLPEPAVP